MTFPKRKYLGTEQGTIGFLRGIWGVHTEQASGMLLQARTTGFSTLDAGGQKFTVTRNGTGGLFLVNVTRNRGR